MDEKRSYSAPIVAVALLLLLFGGYVGSYWMMLGAARLSVLSDDETTVRLGRSPTYSIGEWSPFGSEAHDWLEAVFAPAHMADCQLRPGYWALSEPREVPADYDSDVGFYSDLDWDKDGKLIPRDGTVDSLPAQ